MQKRFQVGYRTNDGKVHYQPLSYEEGIRYNNLKTDIERTEFIKDRISNSKIVDALNKW